MIHERRSVAPISQRRGIVLMWTLASTLMLTSTSAYASWMEIPPALPAPSGRVVNVSNESQLQAAMSTLTSDTTIVLAPGTYNLSRTLNFRGPLTNVGIRGATTRRSDVVLVGPGRDNASYGSTPHGIWVDGDVRNMTIANLTIRDVYFHPIIFNPGPTAPHVYNVHLINGGEQLLKTNPNSDGSGINNGIVEYSVFEYSPVSRNWYANAIQVLGGANWIIRNNLIRNIRAPQGELAGPAVLSWFSSSNTLVEGNTFINCQREISFGLIERTPNDNTGGIIRNNFIYRDASVDGDASITVFDSPNTRVLNNTVLINGTYHNAIEYRFTHTTGVVIANNLVDAAISERDGGTATLLSNSTQALASMFVQPAAGDLHLKASATVAINQGTVLADVPLDWDGQSRTENGAPDVGADEYVAVSSSLPAAPTNVRIESSVP